jgi:hypothetical protein
VSEQLAITNAGLDLQLHGEPDVLRLDKDSVTIKLYFPQTESLLVHTSRTHHLGIASDQANHLPGDNHLDEYPSPRYLGPLYRCPVDQSPIDQSPIIGQRRGDFQGDGSIFSVLSGVQMM